ncbi:hypothetical protein V5F89_10845 [Pelagerythrobacter marensis]|uniref:YD repeat-containing protein n=1 Tax=Pelagerythrobacter marensis TaxID=543877 RepID=A0ABZ2D150_9SPHN
MRGIGALAGAILAMLPIAAQATETVTYTYDAKGRLVKVERSGTVNNGVDTEYQHDKADNRKRVKTTGASA